MRIKLELNWGAIICIIIVVVSGILCYTGHISGEDFLKVVFAVIGLIGGGLIISFYLTRKIRELVEMSNYGYWFRPKVEGTTRDDLTG